jgi:signal transduction histidine kinase
MGEGTGVGLSVDYGIVRGICGTILVESEGDTDAEFHVYLPLVEKENGADYLETVDGETEI